MKICWSDLYSEANADGVVGSLRALGHTVGKDCDDTYDVIFNASVDRMHVAEGWSKQYREIPLINYCWDYYLWAHEGKHSLNWGKYAEFLKTSSLIMVPSHGQQRRLKELLDLDSVVVRSSIETYDHPVTDGRYVLDPVRWYTPDPQCYWVRDACKELGIPFVHSEHQLSLEEFRARVSNCTLMTCGYEEASTGGLTLMEGLWNGKPSLVSDSPYMGAKDYLGPYGHYFSDYEDLKAKLKELFFNPPKINVTEARAYMTKNFSHLAMAKTIEEHLCALKKK